MNPELQRTVKLICVLDFVIVQQRLSLGAQQEKMVKKKH